MGMVLFRTDDENIKAAEHLAPSAELDKLSIPGYIGIMAADDEKRVPAGLAICQMIGLERLDVIWLFVHEDFRNRGIAQQLIMAACDTAISLGYSNIGFRLEARDITDEEYSDLNSFLVANGFSIGFEIEGSLMAGVSDFEIDLDNVRGLGKVSPVDETPPEELESFVRDVSILFDDEDFSEKK
jgi:GNAT superfamily N-acetyltransferase